MEKVKRAIRFVLLLLPAAAWAQPKPAFIAEPGRIVAVVLPSSILTDHDVNKQISSGLTTTFIVIAQHRETDRHGASRIEIRFDLWDEVWIARRIEFDGKEDRQRITSRDALDKWWRNPVRLFAATTDRVALSVALSVLPFSVAEAEDAREWISKSGGLGTPGGGSPLVTALIGTTINAKPIRSYHWNADISFK